LLQLARETDRKRKKEEAASARPAVPRLGDCDRFFLLAHRRRSHGDRLMLLAAAAAYADCANDLATDRRRHAPGKNYNPAMVRRIDAEIRNS
jgi:hypothetical protein